MKLQNKCLALLCFFFAAHFPQVSSQGLAIGEPCPFFRFKDLDNFSSSEVDLNTFRGQWLLLDFWSEYCHSCVLALPRLNKLKKELDGKVTILTVADIRNGTREISGELTVKEIFRRSTILNRLTLPVAYDSTYCAEIGTVSYPFVVLISPAGIVKAITSSLDISQINDFLSGKVPRFSRSYTSFDKNPRRYNFMIPFLTDGQTANGNISDTSFLYRSLLTRWDFGMASALVNFKEQDGATIFEAMPISISRLFMIAYFGKDNWSIRDSLYGRIYRKPIFEGRDIAAFEGNYNAGENVYGYSLRVPFKRGKDALMGFMQQDLDRYFSFHAKLERRSVNCYNLVSLPGWESRLLSTVEWDRVSSLTERKATISTLIGDLNSLDQHRCEDIFDETGIKVQISLKMDFNPYDIEDTNRALATFCLKLVPAKREVLALVISDK